ncbi:hypothetical protein BS78_10G057600 [Paspalum vaginatum]|nr:hypothetical protein BS78_10G057600 [Paspalum vaginatum]
MELDVKPPPEGGCTDDQWLKLTDAERLRLADAQSLFVRVEASLADILRLCDEFTEMIDDMAAHVHMLRRLHAEREGSFGADLAAHVCSVERAFRRLSATARRFAAVPDVFAEMGGAGGHTHTIDELAAAMQRIHIDLGH